MLTPDGRWLVVHVEVGYRRIDVHVLDRQTDRWTTLISGVDATTSFVGAADGRSLVGITNLAHHEAESCASHSMSTS